ncbi:MAG: hypothetical protein WBD02_06960 [Acidimicrobiia bacterium]
MHHIKRRLVDLAERLKTQRADLRILEEQLALLDDEASDANLRALVSQTPLADRDAREMQAQADALRKEQEHLLHSIAAICSDQDALLDKLSASTPYSEDL